MNEEAIKKYQKTHDPYKKLKEVVEKNGTKLVGGHAAEPMSSIEKDLLDTYKEMFGENSHILKSGLYTKDDDGSDKSSKCECADNNNTDLTKRKGKDKYLENLKERCKGGIGFCSVSSILLTLTGLIAAKAAAATYFVGMEACTSKITIFNLFYAGSLQSAIIKAGGALCVNGARDIAGSAAISASAIFDPCGITALVLIILAVVFIILYIWFYRRRKRSWKHECKKHLCK
ncbi:hypothetical protein PFTANZ_06217 [Plasmodium falciparum Tanzania (2000708)]|uniref:Surface antigen n=1 Tax=Plasmodium falciparum Tanzania (2000708) TaxID=1036725 RepID=A0A024VX75_PLAFA|nr:hypothetical protein PFTANZ_06217 [Plasmodium falciparum Tanzania (2000708)]